MKINKGYNKNLKRIKKGKFDHMRIKLFKAIWKTAEKIYTDSGITKKRLESEALFKELQ